MLFDLTAVHSAASCVLVALITAARVWRAVEQRRRAAMLMEAVMVIDGMTS